MKIQQLLLLLLILYGCSSNEPEWSVIEISGKIDSDNISSVTFYPFETWADDFNNLQTLSLDKNGKFIATYALYKPTSAMLIIGDNSYLVYLKPSENISFKYSNQSIDFLSENNRDNSIFIEYQNKFSPFFKSKLNYQLAPQQFVQQVDSVSKEKMLFLESNKKNISKSLNIYLEKDIQFYAAKEKIYFALRYSSDLIKEKNNYFSFLDTMDILDSQALNLLNYSDFIDYYINYLYLKKLWSTGVDFKNDYIEKYYLAKSELRGEALEQFLTANLVLGIRLPIEKEKFKEITTEFLSENYSDKLKNILKQNLSAFSESNIAEGEISPEFSLRNTNNKIYSLSDFSNEFIVLDFWASWCGPCRKGIPKMIELSKKFENKAQFVFVSIDGNENNWKKASKQLGIPEPSLIIDSLSRVNYEFSEFKSIPFYLVLDKNKKVILRNPNGIEEIESLLSK